MTVYASRGGSMMSSFVLACLVDSQFHQLGTTRVGLHQCNGLAAYLSVHTWTASTCAWHMKRTSVWGAQADKAAADACVKSTRVPALELSARQASYQRTRSHEQAEAHLHRSIVSFSPLTQHCTTLHRADVDAAQR